MAITHVKKKVGRTGNIGQNGARQYVDVYQVISSSSSDDAYIISSASFGGVSIPQVGDQHQSDPASLVVRVDPKETTASGVKWSWDVTVEYSTSTNSGGGGGGGGGGEDDPLDMRPVRKWSSTTKSKVVERGKRDGGDVLVVIANAAGEVYDPPVEEEVYLPVLTITRNESINRFGPAVLKTYLGKVCNTPFYGFSKYEALMTNIQADEEFKGQLQYWKVTYEITFGEGGTAWDHELANLGYKHKEAGEDGKIVPNDDGQQRNLDVEGHILGPDDEPIFLIYETKLQADFNALGL